MLLEKAWQNGTSSSMTSDFVTIVPRELNTFMINIVKRWHPQGACLFAMLFLKASRSHFSHFL